MHSASLNNNTIESSVHQTFKESMGDAYDEIRDVFIEESNKLIQELTLTTLSTPIHIRKGIAHQLKSSSAMFGAIGLSTLCEQIEQCEKNSPAVIHTIEKAKKAYDELVEYLLSEESLTT